MLPTTILTMVDGVRVVVPDSLDLITPYVLREQQDWFEDEIKFLRRLLEPGDKVIDIGANYGVYTLSMARTVGPEGHVWAFEPASGTANLLAEGIAANGFAHVNLERSALSCNRGTAQLSLNQNSELNALLHGETPAEASETVALVTLDDCMQRYGWRDIELVKIDAEGEEANILKGGERFLGDLSPLVQYEVKVGEHVHLELVRAFARLGYDSYRLVPGLDLLVPFDIESPADAYQLNLFCCKPDRAARLAARGFLMEVDAATDHGLILKQWLPHLSIGTGSHSLYGWHHALVKLPYGAHLAGLWERTVAAGHSGEVEKALFLHALSRDPSLAPAERFVAWEARSSKSCARATPRISACRASRERRETTAPERLRSTRSRD
jgi:FkbM family methyltransferase